MRSYIAKILVPVDFSPGSDAALDYALTVAEECGAEVELLHVWAPRERASGGHKIFADTAQGLAMEQRLTAAECSHPARVCGRLEFGEEPSSVILAILERELFDLVVMGREGGGRRQQPECGHVAASVQKTARCKVVTLVPRAIPDSAKQPPGT